MKIVLAVLASVLATFASAASIQNIIKEQCRTTLCQLDSEDATDETRLLCRNACLAAAHSCMGDCTARKEVNSDCIAPCIASAVGEYEKYRADPGPQSLPEKSLDPRSVLDIFNEDFKESPLFTLAYSQLDASTKKEVDEFLDGGDAVLFVPMAPEGFEHSKLRAALPGDATLCRRTMQAHMAGGAVDVTAVDEGTFVELKHLDTVAARPHVYIGTGAIAAFADQDFDAQIQAVIESEEGGMVYVVDSVLGHQVISGSAPLGEEQNLPERVESGEDEEESGPGGRGAQEGGSCGLAPPPQMGGRRMQARSGQQGGCSA